VVTALVVAPPDEVLPSVPLLVEVSPPVLVACELAFVAEAPVVSVEVPVLPTESATAFVVSLEPPDPDE
jgi:hypothetical protein